MLEALERALRDVPAPAVAVSGGVDSMTLAAAAQALGGEVLAIHASSPAVPAEASERVRHTAKRRGWRLEVIDAGEFADPDYRANPVNRCFFCKSNLYAAIRARTDRPILSGANLDDLGEYRPGLDAARRFGVRHPYVEASIAKREVRALARELGLGDIAELPASPCLSSRIETGIPIEAASLRFVHAVERMLRDELRPGTVRCRIRASAVVIELDRQTLSLLTAEQSVQIRRRIRARPDCPPLIPVRLEPYRNGSAFLTGSGP